MWGNSPLVLSKVERLETEAQDQKTSEPTGQTYGTGKSEQTQDTKAEKKASKKEKKKYKKASKDGDEPCGKAGTEGNKPCKEDIK